jgi:hypothetical protein
VASICSFVLGSSAPVAAEAFTKRMGSIGRLVLLVLAVLRSLRALRCPRFLCCAPALCTFALLALLVLLWRVRPVQTGLASRLFEVLPLRGPRRSSCLPAAALAPVVALSCGLRGLALQALLALAALCCICFFALLALVVQRLVLFLSSSRCLCSFALCAVQACASPSFLRCFEGLALCKLASRLVCLGFYLHRARSSFLAACCCACASVGLQLWLA